MSEVPVRIVALAHDGPDNEMEIWIDSIES